MEINNLLKIGFIKKPHGIRGELKVLPLTDNSKRYKKLNTIFIAPEQYKESDVPKPLTIKGVMLRPAEVIVSFEGITSRDEADTLRNHYILIERKDGDRLGEWEYYSQDLVGCSVYYGEEKLGIVKNLLNTGANDNLEITTVTGEERVYPFLRDFITSVDIGAKKIIINQYEGFFD